MIPSAPPTETPSARQRVEGRIARLLSGLPGSWLLHLIGEPPRVVDGQTLDAHVQFVLNVRNRLPQRLMSEPTPTAGRRRYQRDVLAATTGSGARPTRVRSVQDLTIDGATGPLCARHYAPARKDADVPEPILLYLHGGGFVNGDLITHDEPCRVLCQQAGIHVLSIAYRLAPEYPFPAALDDAHAALSWLQEQAGRLGADPRRIAIGGDSAGANLATVVAAEASQQGRSPVAQLLIYPTVDMDSRSPSREVFGSGYILTSADMDAFRRLYVGAPPVATRDPRSSPLFFNEPAVLPPTVLTTAGFDPLRDEGEAYADLLRLAGVPVRLRRFSGMVHGYLHMTTIVPAAHAALVETARLLRDTLRETAVRPRARRDEHVSSDQGETQNQTQSQPQT
jgi:acetyl esterase